ARPCPSRPGPAGTRLRRGRPAACAGARRERPGGRGHRRRGRPRRARRSRGWRPVHSPCWSAGDRLRRGAAWSWTGDRNWRGVPQPRTDPAQPGCKVADIPAPGAMLLRHNRGAMQRMAATVELDRTDLRLLALLQQEGRAANAELAARVNLSPSACLRRIQRLEASGVVTGYGARLDPRALGLGLQAFVRVQLEKHGTPGIDRFVAHVQDWEEVVAC